MAITLYSTNADIQRALQLHVVIGTFTGCVCRQVKELRDTCAQANPCTTLVFAISLVLRMTPLLSFRTLDKTEGSESAEHTR